MMLDTKLSIIERHRTSLVEKRTTLLANQRAATAGTRVDGDHRPANRGERGMVSAQGYLAHGIGQRILDVDASLVLMDKMGSAVRDVITTGALFRIRLDDDQTRWFIILPGGDGEQLDTTNFPVTVISPASPIAVRMSGCFDGEEATIVLRGQPQLAEVDRVV